MRRIRPDMEYRLFPSLPIRVACAMGTIFLPRLFGSEWFTADSILTAVAAIFFSGGSQLTQTASLPTPTLRRLLTLFRTVQAAPRKAAYSTFVSAGVHG